MTNLLPDTERKRVLREYNVRRLIVALILASFTGIIVGVALLPSYMHVQGRKQVLAKELAELEESTSGKVSQEYVEQLEYTNRMISILEPREDQIPSYVLLDSILTGLVPGTRLSGVVFERKSIDGDVEGGQHLRLSIEGQAADRETLTALQRSLEEIPYFIEVDLPVSNFAARENIQFSMTLTGEIKGNE